MKAAFHACAVLCLVTACEGHLVSQADTQASDLCAGSALRPGTSPIRRLTRFEYDNTVRDLLGDTTSPANRFPDEELTLGFNNNADTQSASTLLIENYETAATELSTAAIKDLPKLLGCDPATQGQDACMREFLPAFGLRAYRRPLETDETDRLFTFYSSMKGTYDFATGVRLTLEAILQSPYFLYRVETEGKAVSKKVSRLSPYEIATRLSYLFWSSTPDDELYAAAAAGQLDSADGVAERARRMLADPRAKRSVDNFMSQWLDLDKIGKVDKSATLFPTFTADVRTLLRRETELYVEDVVLGGGGLRSLLLGDYTFVNADLASYYGIPGPSDDAFERVTLDPTRRVGLLTQGGLLAAAAKVDQTSPIQRGLFVRERLLCDPPAPPPANLNVVVPAPDPTLTTRERFTRHRTDPACNGCHVLMDPIGFGFEHFDAQGLWRTTENGKAIDATGELVQTTDVDGVFDGVGELSSRLADSEQVRQCVVLNWFRYAYGRSESDFDQCTLGELDALFAKEDATFQDLLIALTRTDAFLYRTNDGAAL